MEILIYVCIVLSSLFLNLSGAQYVTKPVNVAVTKGQSVTLNCTITNAGKTGNIQSWKYYSQNSTAVIISTNDNIVQRYIGSFLITGVYNLKLLSSKLEDGGRYGCESSPQSGATEEYFIYVTVVDNPMLTIPLSRIPALEFDVIRYKCDVNYGGLWPPVISWTNTKAGVLSSINYTCSNSNRISAYVEFIADILNNSETFSCEVTIQENIVTTAPNTAGNIPNYTAVNSTSALEVNYSPRDIVITFTNGSSIPNNTIIFPESEITCTGTSKPPVNRYIWVNSDNNDVIGRSPSLLLSLPLTGMLTIQCELFNVLDDKRNIMGWGMQAITLMIPTSSMSNKITTTSMETSSRSFVTAETTPTIPETTQHSKVIGQSNDASFCINEHSFWIIIGVFISTTLIAIMIIIMCTIRVYRNQKPNPLPVTNTGTVHRKLPTTPINPVTLDDSQEDGNYHQIRDNPQGGTYLNLRDATSTPLKVLQDDGKKTESKDIGKDADHDYTEDPTNITEPGHENTLPIDHGYCQPLQSTNSGYTEKISDKVDYLTV